MSFAPIFGHPVTTTTTRLAHHTPALPLHALPLSRLPVLSFLCSQRHLASSASVLVGNEMADASLQKAAADMHLPQDAAHRDSM